jgi:Cu2+-exporting ATPase
MHDHHAIMVAEFRRRFFVSLIVAIPILLLSPTVQGWLHFRFAFPGDRYVLFALATVVAIYGGWPFYTGAVRALRAGAADMMVLVSLAVISGYLFSAGATFWFRAVDFYWEISTLVVFLLFGHWMEMRAMRSASGALTELVKLIPPTASLVTDGETREVSTDELKVGDHILVRPGEKVPIDGRVIEGATSVNEAMVTGESRPVSKSEGDDVIGGTINGEGSIRVEVTRTGENTALAQIISLVQSAQASKTRTQRLADRAAQYLTFTAIIFGAGAFIAWYFIVRETAVFAMLRAITVVVIACPHALGLAIPIVVTVATTLAARTGMLVRNSDANETAARLDTVIFDKTGTLTKGEFGVSDIVALGGATDDEVLATVAAIEGDSEHTIARGVVASARERGLEIPHAQGFEAIPGRGAKAAVNGTEIYAGNRALMEHIGAPVDEAARAVESLSAAGKTVIYAVRDGRLMGVIALEDIIRDESRAAVAELKGLGLEVAMLTGDSRAVAEHVAQQLGLDTFFAEVQPDQKSAKVKELQGRGKRVAMVGDGINDAPALVQADIGIAIGAGTDVAVESAQVVLVRNDPREVAALVRLSKATMRKMKQNLAWATGYNVIAIPAAAGVLAPFGVVLPPEWAALIMAASSIIVVANALLLRRTKLRAAESEPPAAAAQPQPTLGAAEHGHHMR